MGGGEFGQLFRDIDGVGLGHMGGAEPVQGAQDPEIAEIVLPPVKRNRRNQSLTANASRLNGSAWSSGIAIATSRSLSTWPSGLTFPLMAPPGATGCGCRDTPGRSTSRYLAVSATMNHEPSCKATRPGPPRLRKASLA